jgi:E3 ubiquitin-protein ligase DOA10
MSQSSRSTFVFGFCLLVVLAVLTYLVWHIIKMQRKLLEIESLMKLETQRAWLESKLEPRPEPLDLREKILDVLEELSEVDSRGAECVDDATEKQEEDTVEEARAEEDPRSKPFNFLSQMLRTFDVGERVLPNNKPVIVEIISEE